MQHEIDNHNDENHIRYHIYRFLAHVFREAPNTETLEWLLNLDVEGDEHSFGMPAAWTALTSSVNQTNALKLADEFQLLFIGIGRGEIVPFGSWYLTGSLMELPLVALRQDLRSLGYERQPNTKEPEDHISALLEVMAMLVEENERQQQMSFFNRHIMPWFEPLCRDISRAESATFYRTFAELANTFLTIEKIRFSPDS